MHLHEPLTVQVGNKMFEALMQRSWPVPVKLHSCICRSSIEHGCCFAKIRSHCFELHVQEQILPLMKPAEFIIKSFPDSHPKLLHERLSCRQTCLSCLPEHLKDQTTGFHSASACNASQILSVCPTLRRTTGLRMQSHMAI